MTKPTARHSKRKKSGSLAEPGAATGNIRDSLHGARAWGNFATLSRQNDEIGKHVSDDTREVGDHRSERYRERTEGAARRLRFAREEAGLSVRGLADKSGVDKGLISRFENGELLEISVGRFFDWCEFLSLDPVYVWTGVTRSAGRQRLSSTPPPTSVERPSQRPPKAR